MGVGRRRKGGAYTQDELDHYAERDAEATGQPNDPPGLDRPFLAEGPEGKHSWTS